MSLQTIDNSVNYYVESEKICSISKKLLSIVFVIISCFFMCAEHALGKCYFLSVKKLFLAQCHCLTFIIGKHSSPG